MHNIEYITLTVTVTASRYLLTPQTTYGSIVGQASCGYQAIHGLPGPFMDGHPPLDPNRKHFQLSWKFWTEENADRRLIVDVIKKMLHETSAD